MSRKIVSPKLLVVEGKHEIKFFKRLLEKMELNDIQVEDVGGDMFDPVISGYKKLDGFSQLRSLVVLRDADLSCGNMFASVYGTLRKYDYPVPSKPNEWATTLDGNFKTLIYIFPDNQSAGCLEDLCLASMSDDPALRCVEAYFACLNEVDTRYGINHPHPKKARVQAFLAREEEGDIHMGIAAEKDVWKWESPAFDQVKEMLRNL